MMIAAQRISWHWEDNAHGFMKTGFIFAAGGGRTDDPPRPRRHGEIHLAVRIYSLAKELKIDSKELVDLCTHIGIAGKGSALASLTDEEVVKVQDYLKGPGPKALPRATRGVAVAPERPRQPPKTGKMPVISTPRPAGPLAGARRGAREDDGPDEPANNRRPLPKRRPPLSRLSPPALPFDPRRPPRPTTTIRVRPARWPASCVATSTWGPAR